METILPGLTDLTIANPESSDKSALYHKLEEDEIRLLEIRPGQFFDGFKTKLLTTRIHDAPAYEALSYTWEAEKGDTSTIDCNGMGVLITGNLFSALRRFRDTQKLQYLWVDAICINQADHVERSQQVGLMKHIFRKAINVFMWLGEERSGYNVELAFRVADRRMIYALSVSFINDPSGTKPVVLTSRDEEAMDMLIEIQNEMDSETKETRSKTLDSLVFKNDQKRLFVGWKEFPSHELKPNEPFMMDVKLFPAQIAAARERGFQTFDEFLKEALKPPELSLSKEDLATLYLTVLDLVNRPYFTRKWILQEVILSEKASIACGEREIGFYSFCLLVALGEDNPGNFLAKDLHHSPNKTLDGYLHDTRRFDMDMEGWGVLSRLVEDRKKVNNGQSSTRTLGLYLLRYKYQKATDLRDHVFSLSGIVLEESRIAEEIEFCRNLVDYSLSFPDLCLKVASHIATSVETNRGGPLNQTHILEMFSRRTLKHNPFHLPTWVPDFSYPLSQDSYFNPTASQWLGTSIPYEARVVGRSLFMPAIVVDEVSYASRTLPKEWTVSAAASRLHDLKSDHIEHPYESADGQFEAFWRTTICDGTEGLDDSTKRVGNDGVDPDAIADWIGECRIGYDDLCDSRSGQLKSTTPSSSLSTFSSSDRRSGSSRNSDCSNNSFINADVSDCRPQGRSQLTRNGTAKDTSLNQESKWRFPSNRQFALSDHCFIRTEMGYYGLASPTIEPGDTVAIVTGSNLIWFLDRRKRYFKITGSGWIYGLMREWDPYHAKGSEGKDVVEIEIR